ncbi:MAG: serine hydrolase domain-containing protein [Saprospiraceae bacterium]
MRLLNSLLILLFIIPLSSFGQISLDSIQQYHQENLSDIVLLKNESRLLPFNDLSTTSIAHLSIGDATKTAEFDKILQLYTNVKSFNLPLDATGTQAGEVFKYLINYSDVTIISISDTLETGYSQVVEDFIRDLSKRVDLVYTVFGKAELTTGFPYIEQAKALLYTPKTNVYTQSLAAQIHFGAAGAVGKLSKNIGSTYTTNDGIISKGQLRLGYSSPELTGVNSEFLAQNIETIVQEGLDSLAFPGAQVLVAKNGQVIYQKDFGFHTYDKHQAVRSSDIYDLASVTKVTTAVPALMRMQDDGLFDIDAKFANYFPDFKGSDKEDLYFRSILAHNAQLKPYIVYWKQAQKKNGKYKRRTFRATPHKNYPIKITNGLYLHKKYKGKMMDLIKASPLNKDPGYVYSGLTFLMYPDLVKEKTGKRFDQYLYNTFYKKIGANKLVFNPLERFSINEIIPTENDDFFRNSLVHGTVHDEAAAMLSGISGNAGLFGNTTDLAKLLQLYLNEGSYGGERFIEKSTLQDFTRCQFCDEDNRRGLGFDKPLIEYDAEKSYVAKSASKYSYGHSGFTGTFFWIDPAEYLIVIFLSNRVYPTRENRKLYSMNIRPRLHQAVYDAIYDFDKLKQQEANNKSNDKRYDERK